MSQERRQYRRVPLEASVSFQELSFHKGEEPAQSSYRDVSGGGLLLESSRAYPLGTLLKLEIRVPGWGRFQNHFGPVQEADGRPLVALGTVVRLEQLDDGGYELGIKFQNVYPDDLAALMKFVEASASSSQ
ncbi:MAG TPA: PilZ domain-containing protein [Holophagaceae bacterium]